MSLDIVSTLHFSQVEHVFPFCPPVFLPTCYSLSPHSVTSCATRIFLTHTQRLERIANMSPIVTWGCGPSVSGCRWNRTPTKRTSVTGIFYFFFLSVVSGGVKWQSVLHISSETVFVSCLICSHLFQDHVRRSTGQLSEAVFTGEGWTIQLQCYGLPAAAVVVAARSREPLGPAGGSGHVCVSARDICLQDMPSVNNIWEKKNHQVSYWANVLSSLFKIPGLNICFLVNVGAEKAALEWGGVTHQPLDTFTACFLPVQRWRPVFS